MAYPCASMKNFLRCLILVLAWLHAAAHSGELAQRLKDGAHVLLMRHAYAPGVGDPPGYVLERCETQRVLNEEGRAQAQRAGRWLRAQGLDGARVFEPVVPMQADGPVAGDRWRGGGAFSGLFF